MLLTVTSPVPRWATSNLKAPYVTRPDSQDFREFMTAVARHFGSEVGTYAIWSEPNHPAFLQPQFSSNGSPASPRIYRGLYQAGYKGLQEAGLAHPRVLFGETAPTGYDSVKSLLRIEKSRALLHDVAPLAFLRGALCLNSHYRKVGGCSSLPMSGYAHHAYTTAVAPTYKTPGADNVTIGVLSRLSNALNKAAHAHALPAGLPIYLTEFGVQSLPNKQLGVPVSVQAEYDAMAEQIAYNNGRVAGLLPVSAPGRRHRRVARRERQRRHRRLPDRPRVRQRQAQAALLRLAGPAGREQASSRLLAVGTRAPVREGHHGHRAGAPQGLLQLPPAAQREDQLAGLLEPQLEHRRGASGACAG